VNAPFYGLTPFPAVKFASIRRLTAPGFIKCGEKVPVIRYLRLIGAVWVFDLEYNNARADGHETAAAGAIAAARAADPGFEAAADLGWGIRTWFNNMGNNWNDASD